MSPAALVGRMTIRRPQRQGRQTLFCLSASSMWRPVLMASPHPLLYGGPLEKPKICAAKGELRCLFRIQSTVTRLRFATTFSCYADSRPTILT